MALTSTAQIDSLAMQLAHRAESLRLGAGSPAMISLWATGLLDERILTSSSRNEADNLLPGKTRWARGNQPAKRKILDIASACPRN
jgi:hypothetical protein